MGKSVPPVRLLWCKSREKSRFWPPVRHVSLSLGIFNKMFKRTNGKPTLICVMFSDRRVFHDIFWFLPARSLLQLWFKCSSFSVPSELCKWTQIHFHSITFRQVKGRARRYIWFCFVSCLFFFSGVACGVPGAVGKDISYICVPVKKQKMIGSLAQWNNSKNNQTDKETSKKKKTQLIPNKFRKWP